MSKKIIMIIVLLLYMTFYLSLLFGKYNMLIIAPFIAGGWLIYTIFLFFRDLKPFITDLKAEGEKKEKKIPEDKKDFLQIIHTIAIIFWVLFWLSAIIIGSILRFG